MFSVLITTTQSQSLWIPETQGKILDGAKVHHIKPLTHINTHEQFIIANSLTLLCWRCKESIETQRQPKYILF